MTQLRAVGYVRLSNLTERTTAPERQRESIKSYCDASGWQLVDTIEDLGESGSSVGKGLDRPGIQAIRSRWDEFDVIVVAKLDRLARNTSDWSKFTQEAEQHGVAVASVQEKLDLTTSTGRFVAGILSLFAQMEAEQIRERIVSMRSDMRTKDHDRWLGGNVPYGYRVVPRKDAGKTLALKHQEAEQVREAARRILEGESLYAICQDWNARGVPTKRGALWTMMAIKAIVTGYAVVGVPSHKPKGGERKPRLNDDGNMIQGFPAVLPLDTWSAVRAKLMKPSAKRHARIPALMLGIVGRCAVCDRADRPLKPIRSTKHPRSGERMYKCQMRGPGGCKLGGVMAHRADEIVETEVLARYGNYPVVRLERVESAAAGELAGVEQAIRETASTFSDEDVDLEATTARLAALRARRATLRESPAVESREIYTGQTFAQAWADREPGERAKLLPAVVDAVWIDKGSTGSFDPERVRIEWSSAPELVTPFFEGDDQTFGYVVLP